MKGCFIESMTAVGSNPQWTMQLLHRGSFPVLVLIPGLIAIVVHSDLEDGDQAMPMLIRLLLPPGLRGLLLAAFLAGLMSSIDSMLNSTATLWTKDIYEKFIRKDASDRHYLLVGRLATVVLLLLGVITSPVSRYFEGIYVAVQTFLSLFQGPVFSILLLGIFWRRTTQWGGLAGLVGGIAIAASLHVFKGSIFTIADPFLYVSWWSFVAGILITTGVSMITQPHSDDHLQGLVYGLPQPAGAEE